MVLAGELDVNEKQEALQASYLQLATDAQILSRSATSHIIHARGDMMERLFHAQAKAIEFSVKHHKQIINIKSEIMRQATTQELPEFPSSQDPVFNPGTFKNNARSWTLNLMHAGYESLQQTNIIHHQDGTVLRFPDGFMHTLVADISKLYWFTYFQSYVEDADNGLPEIAESQMVSDFLDVGTDTFSIMLTTEVNHTRENGNNAAANRIELEQSTAADGLLGQLMRMGGMVINDITENHIDKTNFIFHDSAPVIYEPGRGYILDIPRAQQMYAGTVNTEDAAKVKFRGKIPCPAFQGIETSRELGEQEMILLWIVRKLVGQIPDNYLQQQNYAQAS